MRCVSVIGTLFACIVRNCGASRVRIVSSNRYRKARLFLVRGSICRPSMRSCLLASAFCNAYSKYSALVSVYSYSGKFPGRGRVRRCVSLSLRLIRGLEQLGRMSGRSSVR